MVAAELAYGVAKSTSERNRRALEMFLAPQEITPFDEKAVWIHGMPILSAVANQQIGCIVLTPVRIQRADSHPSGWNEAPSFNGGDSRIVEPLKTARLTDISS